MLPRGCTKELLISCRAPSGLQIPESSVHGLAVGTGHPCKLRSLDSGVLILPRGHPGRLHRWVPSSLRPWWAARPLWASCPSLPAGLLHSWAASCMRLGDFHRYLAPVSSRGSAPVEFEAAPTPLRVLPHRSFLSSHNNDFKTLSKVHFILAICPDLLFSLFHVNLYCGG